MDLIRSSQARSLRKAALCQAPVVGLTHTFYRYPARFSPQLARTIVQSFSQPGELILDPFMGGGTSLVEAACLGRRAVGADLSSLAVFVSRVKTTPLTAKSMSQIRRWSERVRPCLSLRGPGAAEIRLGWEPYLYNFSCRKTWTIRKTTEVLLQLLGELSQKNERELVRCAVLRTAQWAVDGQKRVPTVKQFRERFFANLKEMLEGITAFADALRQISTGENSWRSLVPRCINKDAESLSASKDLHGDSPRLILTSPPYPGVHILYHRWQIGGGRETPAPFWIVDCKDGHGAAHYTFGDRKSHDRGYYYEQLQSKFESLSALCDSKTQIIQIVGFSDPVRQLPRYLATMEAAGFHEEKLGKGQWGRRRLWRTIPNRRWYTDQKGALNSSKEVVLFHRPH